MAKATYSKQRDVVPALDNLTEYKPNIRNLVMIGSPIILDYMDTLSFMCGMPFLKALIILASRG